VKADMCVAGGMDSAECNQHPAVLQLARLPAQGCTATPHGFERSWLIADARPVHISCVCDVVTLTILFANT
jgi:hypothetical protein